MIQINITESKLKEIVKESLREVLREEANDSLTEKQQFSDSELFNKFVEKNAIMPGGSALATFKVRFCYDGEIELDFVHWGGMSGSEKENSTTMEEIRQYRDNR